MTRETGLIPPTPDVRSRMVSQARRDTGPEMALRRALHARGLRYRLQYRVPGLSRRTIDIAFTKARLAVFVDGCFWHGCSIHAVPPKNNSQWWREKLTHNRERDIETDEHLRTQGWRVLRFWEHEDPLDCADQVITALRSVPSGSQALLLDVN